MKIFQKEISLPAYTRGFHLITDLIKKACEDPDFPRQGILQVFIKHTSASLTLNENADPTVRGDFERHFNKMIPENASYYVHTYEGADDMPAHLKASVLGSSVMVPLTDGRMNLGTWQGIYLCEHRNRGGGRRIVITAWGQ